MACGIVKKGLIGAGLATAALVWIYGSKTWDVVSTKAEKARQTVQASITSFEDEIALARKQVQNLDPAIDNGIEALAKLEDSVLEVQNEIVAVKTEMGAKSHKIERLSASLDKPGVHRVGGSSAASHRTEALLAYEIDGYKQAKNTLQLKENTLAFRVAQKQRAYDDLMEMKARRRALWSKIQEIEARHKALEASQDFNEFNIDTSPLAQAQKTVDELDRKVSLESRKNELRSEFSDRPALPSGLEPGRDVRREAEEILSDGETAETSL
jgi:chromosome segregation ATPase